MGVTNMQSNEDREVLQRDHRLRLLGQHDRSVNDILLPMGALLVTLNPSHEAQHGWMVTLEQ